MNKNFVLPQTYLTGYTVFADGLFQYLKDTDQEEFLNDIKEAKEKGLSDGEILCSFYAKACYASLTTKKNKNISKIRGIKKGKRAIKSSFAKRRLLLFFAGCCRYPD